MRVAGYAVRSLLIALLFVLVALVMLAATTRRASAQERDGNGTTESRKRAEVTFALAEADDASFLFGRAVARYDEGRALDPGSPYAPRAESRAAALRAHAEGDFAPYVMLERVRREPALSSDPHAVDELVRNAESFPPGLVRIEVWVLAAEAYAHRFGRPGAAEGLLQRVIVDPKAEPVLARKAARDLVDLRVARGDLSAADEAVKLAGSRADPQLARDLHRVMRRKTMHFASIGLLATMLLLAGRAGFGAARRGALAGVRSALAKTWKVAIAYAAYVALGGALLASGYEAGTSKPFLVFGAVLLPIVFVARAWGAAGADAVGVRAARAAICGAAVIGAALLVLESIDVAFLEGVGL